METQGLSEAPDTRIPLSERNPFQIFLAQKMLGEKTSPESENTWANEYGGRISEIIDYPGEIHDLILNHEYSEAAAKILPMLDWHEAA